MRLPPILALLVFAAASFGAQPKETMCVKLKNGMDLCKASGKIEKEPGCETPKNYPAPAPQK